MVKIWDEGAGTQRKHILVGLHKTIEEDIPKGRLEIGGLRRGLRTDRQNGLDSGRRHLRSGPVRTIFFGVFPVIQHLENSSLVFSDHESP